jgi:hypothetical protein
MTIVIHNVEQNTPEWLELRRGMITSSIAKQLITHKTWKIADNDKVRKILYKLAAERITGFIEDGFRGFDMERGNFEEPLAKKLYGKSYDVGFVTRDFGNGLIMGYSPDGFVGDEGNIEIKSANQTIQVERIYLNQVPDEHVPQIQHGLLVSNRKWCDFISYSNGMAMQVIRVEANKKQQEILLEACIQAENKINEIVNTYLKNSKNYKIAERIEISINDIEL